MRVLVAYGSTRGGTEGLAQWVAQGLREEGIDAEALSAAGVGRLGRYDAVIVGGALYTARWHRLARRFVRRHVAELRLRPVYFFSSGPLDDSAAQKTVPPVKGVAALMTEVGARGHITFGGRLSPHARGFVASRMAANRSGDWRDRSQVRDWTRTVAAQLREQLQVAA
jgi:menaquinone-dependent protoporphyrinogen oxidase